jgi:Ca-activated chloride channel family protein
MNEFHFLRPAWLLALPPLLALLFWVWRRQLRSRSWEAVCDPELLPHLLLGRSQRRANWPLWLLLGALLLADLSLAGPAWRKEPQPLFRHQSALTILLDLSRSMNAADLKPSRMERARLKIKDLLRLRREGQTALVAFAGDAFVVTPLTEDTNTIESLLDSLDPELMPVQGSEPQRAIELGKELLLQAGLTRGRLLLVTDEDRPEKVMEAARKLRQKGYDLSVLGVGTAAGAPIPLPEGGFLKDDQGNLVLPELDEGGLGKLAEVGGGIYRQMTVNDSDLQGLLAGLETHRLDQARQKTGTEGARWQEEGVWLLWPLTLLAPLGFRRGWLVLLALMLLPTLPAQASSWSDLWQRPDQKAANAFATQQYDQAGKEFQDPRWKASALYRAGRYREATEALAQPESADDWYNRGNALARSGELAQALNAYEEALKLQPDDADARTNRDMVRKALDKEEQQSGKENQKDQKSEKGDKGSKSTGSQPESGTDSSNQDKESSPQNSQQAETVGENSDSASAPPGKPDDGEQNDAQDKEATADQMGEENPATATPSTGTEEDSAQTAEADASEDNPATEQQRAAKQWLQRIPDDPGGLLRRKFLYQYRQRGRQMETDRPW